MRRSDRKHRRDSVNAEAFCPCLKLKLHKGLVFFVLIIVHEIPTKPARREPLSRSPEGLNQPSTSRSGDLSDLPQVSFEEKGIHRCPHRHLNLDNLKSCVVKCANQIVYSLTLNRYQTELICVSDKQIREVRPAPWASSQNFDQLTDVRYFVW